MANTVIIPHINPLQWYKQTPDTNARFNTRDFDDWYFQNTILPWEQRVPWHQPWQQSDHIQEQLQSTYGPINYKLVREKDDVVIDTVPMNQLQPNYNDPTLFINQIDIDLSIYPEGCYHFLRTFGNPVALTHQSESIVLSEIIENSLLLEFKHFEHREDMIFETGIFPSLRVPGTKKFKHAASKSTVYEDQPLNTEVLRAVAYRIWTMHYGGSEGMPDYMQDKLERIHGCSTLLVDGKYYARLEGATMQESASESYPMRSWTQDMREKLNRASRRYENELSQDAVVAVMINSDSKGFGNDIGGNETVVHDVE